MYFTHWYFNLLKCIYHFYQHAHCNFQVTSGVKKYMSSFCTNSLTCYTKKETHFSFILLMISEGL